MGQAVLLTGQPRVGKTTIIKQIVAALGDACGGFYTEEIRERGQRVGFKLVTISGQEGTLAHIRLRDAPHIGKYGVNLGDLQAVGVTAIRQAIATKEVVVIDEIGKMEMLSESFRDAVWEALDSDRDVVGTIMLRPHPWADAIKENPRVTVIEVYGANRDVLADQVLELLGRKPGPPDSKEGQTREK
ncbi:MAG TPA: NTPase [Anaerolineae bacterium]|nr:NTPase [Anaerolineae bacterium]